MAKKNKDVLAGLARVGVSKNKTPLLMDNNWVEFSNEEYSGHITSASSSEGDLSGDLELLRILSKK